MRLTETERVFIYVELRKTPSQRSEVRKALAAYIPAKIGKALRHLELIHGTDQHKDNTNEEFRGDVLRFNSNFAIALELARKLGTLKTPYHKNRNNEFYV